MSGKGWAVCASLVTRRCGDSARMRAAWPWRRVRHGALWVSTWLELAGGLGRLYDNGAAVLCLQPPRLRSAGRLVAVLGAVMVAGGSIGGALALVWPPLVAAPVVALGLFCTHAQRFSWRHRVLNRQLRDALPAGAWHLHNFAADPGRPGAGRVLLEEVCAEADRRGWVLYLDTVVARLVDYYGEAGFAVVAVAAAWYAGETLTITRMVRVPASPSLAEVSECA